MAQTVAQFNAMVESIFNLGPDLTSFVQQQVTNAVRTLEQRHTWQYMRRDNAAADTHDPALANHRIPLAAQVKDIIWMRWGKSDSTVDIKDTEWKSLDPVDPDDILTLGDVAEPSGFYLAPQGVDILTDQITVMVLDSTPEFVTRYWLIAAYYTDWLNIDTTKSHWMLDHANALLLASVVVLLEPFARDTEIVQRYGAQIETLFANAKTADLRMQIPNQKVLEMRTPDPVS